MLCGEFQPGVRCSWSEHEDHRSQLLHPGRLARDSEIHIEPRPALRIPAQSESGESESYVAADGQQSRCPKQLWTPVRFCLRSTRRRKTSLRGGWGIYYGRVINSTVYNALVNTGVGTDVGQRQFTASSTNLPAACSGLTVDNCTLLPIYPNLLPASTPPVGAVQFFDPDFQLPQIHQWDFIFEREVSRNTVVSASYLGSYGNSLPNFVDK